MSHKGIHVLDETDQELGTYPTGQPKYGIGKIATGEKWLYYNIDPNDLEQAISSWNSFYTNSSRYKLIFKKITPTSAFVSML